MLARSCRFPTPPACSGLFCLLEYTFTVADSRSRTLSQAELEALARKWDFAWLFESHEIAFAHHKQAAKDIVAAQKRALRIGNKDYLTVREAAEYMCVSYSHFRAKIQSKFPPKKFEGKLLYRRSDLQRLIEMGDEWRHSTKGTRRIT